MGKAILGVPFRNTVELVDPFFFFIRKMTGIPIKIVAVDDGSTDGTREKLLGHMRDDDKIICNPSKYGITKSWNLIVNETLSENKDLFLFNSDVFIMQNRSLDSMYSILESNRNLGFVYGTVYSGWDFSTKINQICFCLINIQVFKKIGGFDEQFEVWCQDNDFLTRVLNSGFKHELCPSANAIHFWGSTISKELPNDKAKAILESDRAKYQKKWGVPLH